MEPFRIGNECPVHSIAGNLPWEPSDFHMKRKGLAASCGESIRADWTGLGACPSVRPGSEGAAGAASGSGASYCDPYSGIQQDGSGGSPPAPRLGMKSGNPLRQAVCASPDVRFAEQEIDRGVQRVGDADECGVVGSLRWAT